MLHFPREEGLADTRILGFLSVAVVFVFGILIGHAI